MVEDRRGPGPKRGEGLLARRPMTVIGAVAAVVLTAVALPQSTSLWDTSGAEARVLFEHGLNDRGATRPLELVALQGFSWGDHGLWVEPGATGIAGYQIAVPPGRALHLALDFYNGWLGVACLNAVEISEDGGATFTPLARNVKLRSDRPLTVIGPPNGRLLLRLAAKGADDAEKPVLVIDGVRVSTAPTVVVPRTPVAAVLMLIGWVLVAWDLSRRLTDRPRRVWQTAGIVGAVVLVLAISAMGFLDRHAPGLSGVLALGYLAAHVVLSRRRPADVGRFATVMLLFVLAIGMGQRMHLLGEKAHTDLNADVVSYRELAVRMRPFSAAHGFYVPTHREPVFVLIGKLVLALFGNTLSHMRYISMIFSGLLIWLGYRLARDRLNPAAGLLVGLMLAVTPDLVGRSIMGMRMEVYACELTAAAWLVFTGARPFSRRRAAALAGLGAVTVLTNLSSIPFLVLLGGYALLTRRLSLKRGGAAAAAIALIVLPFFIRHQVSNGSAFYVADRHATWYRNSILMLHPEWREQQTAPMPTVDQIREDGYAGPMCTTADLFFRLHTFGKVVSGVVLGYWDMFGGGWLLPVSSVLLGLALAGFATTLATKARPIMLAVLGALPPYLAFLHRRRVLPRRLVMQGHVFLFICADHALLTLLDFVRRSRSPEPEAEPPPQSGTKRRRKTRTRAPSSRR